MSGGKQNPIRDELLVDRNEVNRQRVVDALAPLVKFTEDGELLMQPRFRDLDSRRRIATVLLGRWAMHDIGLASDPAITIESLAEYSEISSSTVALYMNEKFPFVTETDGRYQIPDESVLDAVSFLEEAR